MGDESMVKQEFDIYWVDAFTEVCFSGNPAVVVVLKEKAEDVTLQAIASEMNVSETVFIKKDKEDNEYLIRWFTPKNEVDLCGHATIAASKVLFDELKIKTDKITYNSKSGVIIAKKEQEEIVIDLPLDEYKPMMIPGEVAEALQVKNIKNCIYGKHTKKLVFHLQNENEVLTINPDFEKMKKISLDFEIKGVGVTSKCETKYDFISRYFNPWAGVNEDPVTGSVHTVLAAYWSDLLGKTELYAYQASKRGGELKFLLSDNRIYIHSKAVTLIKGKMFL